MRLRKAEPGVTVKGVSRRVRGRERVGTRVTYEDLAGRGTSERVVLRRCRRAGYGCYRLRPSVWRTLARIEELRVREPGMPMATILERLAAEGALPPSKPLVEDLLAGVPARRLAALMKRHTGGDVDPARPGVPDLFVFKRRPDGRPMAIRFVEVKRPGERVMPHQLAEIAFMRSLHLKAGVLRLIEAK